MNPSGNNNPNNSQNDRSQILNKIKSATNILITVSDNPSVDQLCSMIGLSLVLHKLDKHSTAVYSGETPPALAFLEPGKTLEKNVDSLRDLIISLDKNKADKLHYKQEGEFVKIYITPYRTKIDQNDFTFEQGDYNVELVIALGVSDRGSIDQAIAAHGKILHDATVVTISCGQQDSEFGSVNWSDKSASSLAEMMSGLVMDMGKDLLDQDSATALLTGVVAETDRFSNDKTTPRVMTLSAQLMGKGANQQLISSQLSSAASIISFSAPEPEPSPIVFDHTGAEEDTAPSDPTELSLTHEIPTPDPAEQITNSETQIEQLPDPSFMQSEEFEQLEEQHPEQVVEEHQAEDVQPMEPENIDNVPASTMEAYEAPEVQEEEVAEEDKGVPASFDPLTAMAPEEQEVQSAEQAAPEPEADLPPAPGFSPIPIDSSDLDQLLQPVVQPTLTESLDDAVDSQDTVPTKVGDMVMPTASVAPTPFEFVPIKPNIEEQKIVGKVVEPGGQGQHEMPKIKTDHSRSFLGTESTVPAQGDFSEAASGGPVNNFGFLGHGSGTKSEPVPAMSVGSATPSPWSPPVVDLGPAPQPSLASVDDVPPTTFRIPAQPAPTPVPVAQPIPQAPGVMPSGDITLPPPIAPPPTPM